MKKIPVFLMSFVMIFACLIVGCTKLTVIRNEVETCAALSTKLVSAFYNKEEGAELIQPTNENFYLGISDDEEQDLTAITINNVIYKKEKIFRFSVGNNNFLEVPIWKLEDAKMYVALPVLYAEAKGGITKIEAGKRNYSIRVFKEAGSVSIGEVGVFHEKEGATATKQADSAGEIIVKHARQSGQTSVGFVLTKSNKPLEKGLTIYTRKYFEDNNSISYGVDVTSSSEETGFTFEFYNYYQKGAITTPKNRTIKYSVAVVTKGNITFELQINEKIPENRG